MDNSEDAYIREATPADKDEVLGMRDDVYEGRDYLPAFYDNFMTSPFTTSFVVIYKGQIVSFSSATLLDNGGSFAARAVRVRKEYEGAGFSRMTRIHMEEWAKKRLAHRKVTVASENHLAAVSKPSFTSVHRHILTKEVLHYQLEPWKLKLLDSDIQKAGAITEELDGQLAGYMGSETAKHYLFPKDRIVVNSVPYRIMEANIPAIKEQKGATIIISDVHFRFQQPRGMLSVGTIFRVTKPSYAYNIELYGSDINCVSGHIVKHLLRLMYQKEKEDIASIYVFVDENFPFESINKIFADLGMEKKQREKRLIFEKSLHLVNCL